MHTEIWVWRSWERATLGWQRPLVQVQSLRPNKAVGICPTALFFCVKDEEPENPQGFSKLCARAKLQILPNDRASRSKSSQSDQIKPWAFAQRLYFFCVKDEEPENPQGFSKLCAHAKLQILPNERAKQVKVQSVRPNKAVGIRRGFVKQLF